MCHGMMVSSLCHGRTRSSESIAIIIIITLLIPVTAELDPPQTFRNKQFPVTACGSRDGTADHSHSQPHPVPNPRWFPNHLYRCEAGETDSMRAARFRSTTAGLPFRGPDFGVKIEAAECSDFDKEDPDWTPDPAFYPWSTGVTGKGGRRRQVVYGTSHAQAIIHQSQHPANCATAKYLMLRVPDKVSMEESLQVASAALGLAIDLGRVLVWDPTWVRFPFGPFPHCPGDFTWDCWLEPITSCPTPTAKHNVLSKTWADLEVLTARPYTAVHSWQYKTQSAWEEAIGNGSVYTPQTGPTKLRRLLECSPIKNDHWFYWWRAQTTAYLFRPSAATLHGIATLRSTLVSFKATDRASAVGKHAVSGAALPPQTIGVFMPLAEEKARDAAKRTSQADYQRPWHRFDEYAAMASRLAGGGDRKIPVLDPLVAEGSPSVGFVKTPLAKTIFIAADSHTYIAEVARWQASTNASELGPAWKFLRVGHNVTVDSRFPDLPVKATGVGFNPRLASGDDVGTPAIEPHGVNPKRHGDAIGRSWAVLHHFTAIVLLLETDATVCSLASPLCRVVDGLRMTVGGRTGGSFVDWSAGVRGGMLRCGWPKWEKQPLTKRDRACYLGY